MLQQIQQKLSEIEAQHNVSILYACESGSRAWGFPSTDSDFDVRFIYAQPGDTYLSIDETKDTIDVPVDAVLDINGWDLKKSLKLFRNSNAAVYEWLQSPIVYKQSGNFLSDIRIMMPEYFSLRDGLNHYMGVARNSFNALTEDEVKLKKYFYCVRSILAAMWIVEKKEIPPMEFGTLRTLVKYNVWHSEIDRLLAIKTAGDESTLVPPITLLHSFIATNLALCEEAGKELVSKKMPASELNKFFKELIYAV